MNCCAPTFLAALIALVPGCKAPTREVLQEQPYWQRVSQRMVSNSTANASGLIKAPFPDLKNPVHVEIWEALDQEGKVGDGFGTVCDYFGFYLVNVSIRHDHGIASYFYEPEHRHVYDGSEDMAFMLYGGDKSATLTNALTLVRYLLAVSGYQAFVINEPGDIPHTRHQSNHPDEPFKDLLLSKGISIHPPEMLKRHEDADALGWTELSECSVFAYCPLGGRVIRYEIQYRQGQIIGFEKYVLGASIGDCWFIM